MKKGGVLGGFYADVKGSSKGVGGGRRVGVWSSGVCRVLKIVWSWMLLRDAGIKRRSKSRVHAGSP